MNYARVPDYDTALETGQQTEQTTEQQTEQTVEQQTASVQATPATATTGTHEDSVFSNLPTYEDIVKDPVPDYEDEGLDVGDLPTFILSALCTMIFQLIGFFLCFMFSTSHASRLGAMAGLGINIFQYAVYFRERHLKDHYTASIAYLIMVGGMALTFESLISFIKLRRLQSRQ